MHALSYTFINLGMMTLLSKCSVARSTAACFVSLRFCRPIASAALSADTKADTFPGGTKSPDDSVINSAIPVSDVATTSPLQAIASRHVSENASDKDGKQQTPASRQS